MNMSFLVIDFIIFTVAAILGFIWGAMWVDSEFERDSAYLAAEVETLIEGLEALHDSYNQELLNGDKMFIALQKATDEIQKKNTELRNLVDEIDKMKKEIEYRKSPEAIRDAVREAWRKAND